MDYAPEHVVFMEHVASGEHYAGADGKPKRALADISVLIRKSETWGIIGPSLFEVKLLLEIMANIKPYDGGRCVLMEQGMLRRKRVILRHVFYLGNADMVYDNMKALEYLMFVTGKLPIDKVDLQEKIFEQMIEYGLGPISLTPNYLLTKEEKAVLALFAAAYSGSLIIIFNLPEYDFDEVLAGVIARLSAFIREKGKTLVLGSQNCHLIEKACSHSAVLQDGKIIFSDTVDNFRNNYDPVIVTIQDKQAETMAEKLAELLPGCQVILKNNRLMISSSSQEKDPGMIYKRVLEAGFIPERMEINPKTVQNAYEELIRRHDLQKQLL
ncbi:MAG: hypothetical protein AWM53_01568 [Candidatus Dichloromethanomonas elyunquensis]|nr:MAG: hypothetical protein AWM53_01568 [Candidatus Dichloromethanomonas elyunquensis]